MTTEFEIGDKVRLIKTAKNIAYARGENFNPDGVFKLTNVGHRLVGWTGVANHFARRFELALPEGGPVRTVTKRELVPGMYGSVKVHESREAISVMTLSSTDAIRQTIKTLQEILDFMEEE